MNFDIYKNISFSQAGSNGSGGGGGGGGTTTFDTDSGTATPAAGVITFNAISQAGASVFFSGAGSTVSLNTSDSNMNTIIGIGSGNGSITGGENQGFGGGSLFYLTSGHDNTAIGHNSLRGEVAGPFTGTFNTATGNESLSRLLSGSWNCAFGYEAGFNYQSSESSNISIGYDTFGTTGESNVLRIGNGTGSGNGNLNKAFISGINGATIASQVPVAIDPSTDQLAPSNGTNASLPAFFAYLSTEQDGVTGDGTIVTVPFDTVVFDRTSSFASNTFTAPITGVYMFTAIVQLLGLLNTNVGGNLTLVVAGTSSGSYVSNNGALYALIGASASGADQISITTLVPMTATDTCTVTLDITSNATKNVDIYGQAGPVYYTYFNGYLVG